MLPGQLRVAGLGPPAQGGVAVSHVPESHANTIVQGSPTQGARDLRQRPFLGLSAPGRWALQLCPRTVPLGFLSLPTSWPPGLPGGEGGRSEPPPPRPSSFPETQGSISKQPREQSLCPGQARTLSPRLPNPPRICQR